MTKFYRFPSGLHLIYHRNPSIETSSIVLSCKTGSVNEDEEYHGASHMIEHMVFRGTSKYPDIESISRVFDNIGADINASTDKNITKYIAKCHSNDFYKCISVLFDMLCCSVFSLKNLQNEKKIVKEELLENKDDTTTECLLNLVKLLFHGTDYERDVIGDIRTINNLTLKNLLKYYKTNYIPSNMFLSIHTNLSYDIILRELKKIKFVTKKKINPKSSYISKLDYKEPENKLVVKYNKLLKSSSREDFGLRLKQTHLAIGFRFPFGFTDKKRDYIVSIIARYLGGTMSSIIYVSLTKSIGAGHTIYV
jgi:predicted Zn-dependent peptidase